MFDFNEFPKAEPVERGCGEREPGGVYAECGLSPSGSPLERFLIDPPQPLADGLDLVNKPCRGTAIALPPSAAALANKPLLSGAAAHPFFVPGPKTAILYNSVLRSRHIIPLRSGLQSSPHPAK